MGCLLCKFKFFQSESTNNEPPPKQYSWDQRKIIDIEFFMAQNLVNEIVHKKPGTINGHEFVIQNCKSCKILIMDYTATVTIDDCTDCFILLGPVKSSVFLRDCTDCKVALSCQQFRTRDCKRIELFLHCVTQPIIEASLSMKFACLQYNYPGLSEQMEKSGLSRFNNNWSDIHDFTPIPGEKNFSFLPNGVTFSDELSQVNEPLDISVDPFTSCIPLTFGNRPKLFGESCMVVFFKEPNQIERIQTFLRMVLNASCILIQTKEIQLSLFEAERLFGKSHYSTMATTGALVTLEINGVESCAICLEKVKRMTGIDEGQPPCDVFVSTSYETNKLFSVFYNLTQMQMSV